MTDPDAEAIWRQDDIDNDEILDTDTAPEDARKYGFQSSQKLKKETIAISFRGWQATWRSHIRSFKNKLCELSFRGPLEGSGWEKLVFELPMMKLHYVEPPHMFFTEGERAIFKNLSSWDCDDDAASPESSWYELPGPSDWWPENYDYRRHGFDVSAVNLRHQEALTLVLNDFEEVPEVWNEVFPSETELCLVSDTLEGRLLLNLFH